MKRAALCVFLLLLVAACKRESHAPQTQTTVIISEAEEEVLPPIRVHRFDVAPDAVRRGQPATASVELDASHPGRRVSIDWYGPDGWLVSYGIHPTDQARFTAAAPQLTETGRYRAVLRAGRKTLAEDGVTVTG